MKDRELLESTAAHTDNLPALLRIALEVLLDIRELLAKIERKKSAQ